MINSTFPCPIHTEWNITVFSYSVRIIFPIIWAISLLLSSIGSGLILNIIFGRFKRLPPTEVLLINLALVDFFFVLSSIVYMIPMVVYESPTSQPLFPENTWQCRLFYAPVMITSYGSCLTLAALAMIRYIKIEHDHVFLRYINRSSMIAVSIGIWTFSTLCSLFPIYGFWGKLKYSSLSGLCSPNFGPILSPSQITYNIFIVGLFYCVFNSTCGWCYFKIYKILSAAGIRKQYHDFCKNHSKDNSRINHRRNYVWLRREKNIAFTLFIIFIGNLATYGPAAIVMFLQMINELQSSAILSCILLTVMYTNSVINPYILIGSSSNYRRYLIKRWRRCLLWCCCVTTNRVIAVKAMQ
ncbi:Opsin, ultraviolet-sensitive [Trichoplax sp. H2]|nr:Opsin, ultraviolet-sensitive [Trichoplax sp. H2]|eukprot:RDD39214.1 Opsin, ultraviolet-sensitive [Trichoplax sp. H2]